MSKAVQGYSFIEDANIANRSITQNKTSGEFSFSRFNSSGETLLSAGAGFTTILSRSLFELPETPQGRQLWFFQAKIDLRGTTDPGARNYNFRLVLLSNVGYPTDEVLDASEFITNSFISSDRVDIVLSSFYTFNPVSVSSPVRTVALQYTRSGELAFQRSNLISARIA